MQPENFDWRVFLLLTEVKDDDDGRNTSRILDVADLDTVQHPFAPQELNRMHRAGIIASVFSALVGLLTWVVWPLPLYRDYVFNAPVGSIAPLFLGEEAPG